MEIPWRQVRAPTRPVGDLHDVQLDTEILSVTSKTHSLDRLPAFSKVSCLWTTGFGGEHLSLLPSSKRLNKLVLHGYRGEDLVGLRARSTLRSLAVWNAPRFRSFHGVHQTKALTELLVGDV